MIRLYKQENLNILKAVFILYPLIQFGYIKLLFNNYIMLTAFQLFCILIALLVVLKSLSLNLKFDKITIALLLFIIWIIISKYYSISLIYAREKLNLLLEAWIYYWLIRSVILNYSLHKEKVLSQLFKIIIFINIILILVYVIFNFNLILSSFVLGNRLESDLTNPIWFARFISETILGILIFMKRQELRKKWLIVLLPLLLLVIVSGSKGPIVSILVSYVLYMYISEQNNQLSISKAFAKFFHMIGYIILIGMCIILIMLLAQNILPEQFLQSRFSMDSIFVNAEGYRYSRYFITFGIIKENFLLGVGLGGWPILYSGVDVLDYPHNIVLEIMSETGIVGMLLFLSVFVCATQKLHVKTDEYKFIYTMYLFNLINAMFSGDIASGNRGIFIYLGILSALNVKGFIEKTKNRPFQKPSFKH